MIKIYGSSDDLIEVEGDITEEFGISPDYPNYVGCSNGALLKVTYDDDGEWMIKVINPGPNFSVDLMPVGWKYAINDYTQTAVVSDFIEWVVCGAVMARL